MTHPQKHQPGLVRLSTAVASTFAMALLFLCAPTSWAVHPAKWIHASEADFQQGELQEAVATNQNVIKPARRTIELADLPETLTSVFDIERIDDAIFVAGGPESQLLKVSKGNASEVMKWNDGNQPFALGQFRDHLLVGVSGDSSSLLILDKAGKTVETVALSNIRYIWDIQAAGDVVYLACGTPGKVLALEFGKKIGEPKQTTVFDLEIDNILCVASDGKGHVYAGTDSEGLIIKATKQKDGSYKPFVLHDADQAEIGTIIVFEDGTVYAGTADVSLASQGRMTPPSMGDDGEPAAPAEPMEGEDEAVTIPLGRILDKTTIVELEGDNQQAEKVAEEVTKNVEKMIEAMKQAGLEPEGDRPNREEMEKRIRKIVETLPESSEMTLPHEADNQQVIEIVESVEGEWIEEGPGMMPGFPGQGGGMGNVIYQISPEGFVKPVFSESATLLKMLRDGNSLVIATGNEGRLYRLDLANEETTVLLDLEAQQITSLLLHETKAGSELILGTANQSGLYQLDPRPVEKASFTSPVLDAGHAPHWGLFKLAGDVPEGTQLELQARSGNMMDTEKGLWSQWTPAQTFTHDAGISADTPVNHRFSKELLPHGRFFQYRVTLVSTDKAEPTFARAEMNYLVPNMAPEIQQITVGTPDMGQGNMNDMGGQQAMMMQQMHGGMNEMGGEQSGPGTPIQWMALDPNQDALSFQIEYRPVESDQWITLEKDWQQPGYGWSTGNLPDGRYVVRVTASDKMDNPGQTALTTARKSSVYSIDNTPPAFGQINAKIEGKTATLTVEVTDKLSDITQVRYTLNSKDDWKPILPDDLIFDSTSEQLTVKLSGLSLGRHAVTLKAVDSRGNQALTSTFIEVK